MALRLPECRKFAPNIFNQSKCANCFRQKEEHSAAALESSRASRKVSKCGYLFVAPDWDFSNPVNRTKRWQRRWFVLYDDGELTYSVDEHPETVPQALIDMGQVLEVTSAEEVTGSPFSLAITAPDRVTFVKGTCREEARWWADVLAAFPRSKGRHKRNATFPGGKATTILPVETSSSEVAQPRNTSSLPTETTPPVRRPRFHSCHSEPLQRRNQWAPQLVGVIKKNNIEKKTTNNRMDFVQLQENTELNQPTRRTNNKNNACRDTDEDTVDSSSNPGDVSLTLAPPSPSPPPIGRERDVEADDTPETPVRGDPDGSNRVPPCPSLQRFHESTPHLLSLKKGWLLQQNIDREWHKRWFVLTGTTLVSFQDSTAEDNGDLGGLVDMTSVCAVNEADVGRNYGFQLLTTDDKEYILSAVTSGIRSHWIQALRNAANINTDNLPSSVLSVGENLDREMERLRQNFEENIQTPLAPLVISRLPELSLSSHRPAFSSDEEYRTASETSGGGTEEGENGGSASHLPPSPPLNRTVLSKVKEKARTRINTRGRVQRRWRSSPSAGQDPDSFLQPLFVSSVRSIEAPVRSLEAAPASPIDDTDMKPEKDLSGPCGVIQVPLDESLADPFLEEASTSRGRTACREQQRRVIGLLDSHTGISSMQDLIRRQNLEMEALKRKLNTACSEKKNAERETEKLKKDWKSSEERLIEVQSRVAALERQVEELVLQLEERDARLKKAEEYKVSADNWKDLFKQLEKRYAFEREEWEVRLEKAENLSLENMVRNLQETCAKLQEKLNESHAETEDTKERLERGIEENKILCQQIRHLESPTAKEKGVGSRGCLHRVDSLSDLIQVDILPNEVNNTDKETLYDAYTTILTRFERSIREILALRRELKVSQSKCDEAELLETSLRRGAQLEMENSQAAQLLLVQRVDDLANKLSASEKQSRQLRQKAKSESRERRRTLSLRGKESFHMSKEVETKLAELEQRIGQIDRTSSPKPPSGEPRGGTKRSRSVDDAAKRLRRKSLDGATSSQPLKLLERVTSLEARVDAASAKPNKKVILVTKTKEKDIKEHHVDLSPSSSASTEEPLPIESQSQLLRIRDSLSLCLSLINKNTDLIALPELISELQYALNLCSVDKLQEIDKSVLKSVHEMVVWLKDVLGNKINQLTTKKQMLKSSDKSSEIRFWAELVSFESVVFHHLIKATNSISNPTSLWGNHISEAQHQLAALERKLHGSKETEVFNSLEVFTQKLTERVLLCGRLACMLGSLSSVDKSQSSKPVVNSEEIQRLEEQYSKLTGLVDDYVEKKIVQLAALINQDVIQDDSVKDGPLQACVSEVRSLSHDAARNEIVQTQIGDMLERLARRYEMRIRQERGSQLILMQPQQTQMEVLMDVVENQLTLQIQQMEKMLQQSVKSTSSNPQIMEGTEDAEKLLSDLSDVVAHKALLNSHLEILKGTNKNIIKDTKVADWRPNMNLLLDEDSESWNDVECAQLLRSFVEQCCKDVSGIKSVDVCDKCSQLHQEIMSQKLQHTEELTSLRKTLTLEWQEKCRNSQSSYLLQLNTLQNEHSSALKDASKGHTERDVLSEESIRQRYQAEIEQLRALCEKGLVAMENSHRRMIADLEDKHQLELSQLQVEKEQALAEETQATLAALDAMRKAHEAEVQREVAKFKEDFLRRMQPSRAELSALHREHEAEMDDIKYEILSLSEKYSIKCLESATLEEQTEGLRRELKEVQARAMQLEERNEILRAHLASEVATLSSTAQTDNTGEMHRLHQTKLVEKDDQLFMAKSQLESAKVREEELSTACRQLGHYLRAERQLRTDQVSSLRGRLEHVVLTAARSTCTGSSTSSETSPTSTSPEKNETSQTNIARRKATELVRSPSCPRLSSLSPFLSLGGLPSIAGGPSLSPLRGMVASRKRVFETAQ